MHAHDRAADGKAEAKAAALSSCFLLEEAFEDLHFLAFGNADASVRNVEDDIADARAGGDAHGETGGVWATTFSSKFVTTFSMSWPSTKTRGKNPRNLDSDLAMIEERLGPLKRGADQFLQRLPI